MLPVEPIQEPAHPLIQAYRRKEEWLVGSKAALLYSNLHAAVLTIRLRSGMALTCHTAFFSPSSLEEIREKSAQTMREVVSLLLYPCQ